MKIEERDMLHGNSFRVSLISGETLTNDKRNFEKMRVLLVLI